MRQTVMIVLTFLSNLTISALPAQSALLSFENEEEGTGALIWTRNNKKQGDKVATQNAA